MMTIAEQYEFDLNGFIIYKNVLTASELRKINSILKGISPAKGTGKFSFFELHPFFAELMARPQVVEILRVLCGEWVRFDHAFGIEMRNDRRASQGLHAGNRANQGAFAYQWASGRMHNGLVKVLYSLTGVNSGDGGFVCIPGSHKANVDYRPARSSHLVVNPSIATGDMLIFTEALVHGSRPWKRNNCRRALIFSYAPGCLAWKDPRTLQSYSTHIVTDTQRDLFRPPFVGDYDEQTMNDDGTWGRSRRTTTRR